MNFNPISKWIIHKKSSPWCGSPVVCDHACGFQSCSHTFHVSTFKTKVPKAVRAGAMFLHRNMNVEAVGIEPHAATNAQRFWFWDFLQTQKSDIKCACHILAALGHGYVNVG